MTIRPLYQNQLLLLIQKKNVDKVKESWFHLLITLSVRYISLKNGIHAIRTNIYFKGTNPA